MKTLRITLCLSVLVLLSSEVSAVTVTTRGIQNKAVYGILFEGESRAYYGKEATVSSISKQEYVTATYRVLEVNVVTNGSALLRIYYSRLLRPGELQQALSDSAAGVPTSSIIKQPLPPQVEAMASRASKALEAPTSSMVIKEYPIATHSRTIEYRLSSRQELVDLHDELKKHWLKEPAYYEGGQIIDEEEATTSEMKPRTLGGTLFKVKG